MLSTRSRTLSFFQSLAMLALIAATLALSFAGTARADCDAQRRAFAEAAAAQAEAAADQRQACGDLRLCKADCRILKKECKKTARSDKFLCIEECNALSGRDKRQCKRECRADKRIAKAGCRRAIRECRGTCRDVHRTPECQAARSASTQAAINASLAGVALAECERQSGNEDAQ
ncbi:hypothetical protein [Rhodobium gokarnense]|uniref:Uncharacterized protein n=1 Tax=Rhodobium gokarnense TaxID=364296 RepID=A0ABT3HGX0_9HYPH|nr:hypothetical protein [Rhodobium gokarnense]MCW2309639.1 hypothetical protein [Rhodobium gokarnense]